MDGLDDKTIVSRVIEEASAFARRTELGKNILARQRDLFLNMLETWKYIFIAKKQSVYITK